MRVKTHLTLVCLLTLISLAEAMELKTDFLGNFEVNGALTGYFLSGKRVAEEAKKNRIDVSSSILGITNTGNKTLPFEFTLVGGAYAMPTIGIDTAKTADYVDIFSPLPIVFMEVEPVKSFRISIGRMGTLIGYEAPFTYQNNYIQRGLVWNMQPFFHHGLRFSYIGELYQLKVGINDGYYSLGVDSYTQCGRALRRLAYALEGAIGFTPLKDLNVTFNFLIPEKDARPNEVALPANKRQYNLVTNYNFRNFTFGTDLLYVYAPSSTKAQVTDSAKAYGFALHFTYDYSPFRFSLRAEYVKDKKDKGALDLVGIGENNQGFTLTFTPGYYRDPLLIRAEVSYIKAQKDFADIKRGVPNSDFQTRFGLEWGFRF